MFQRIPARARRGRSRWFSSVPGPGDPIARPWECFPDRTLPTNALAIARNTGVPQEVRRIEWWSSCSPSEAEFDAGLQGARIKCTCGLAEDRSRRVSSVGLESQGKIGVGQVEVNFVDHIERFQPKLHLRVFLDGEAARQSEVFVDLVRPAIGEASQGSVLSHCGRGKDIRIEQAGKESALLEEEGTSPRAGASGRS